jgi:hypothetical protein
VVEWRGARKTDVPGGKAEEEVWRERLAVGWESRKGCRGGQVGTRGLKVERRGQKGKKRPSQGLKLRS